jgi:hypothetical protein
MKARTVVAGIITFVWLVGFGLWTTLWEPPVTGNEWGDWAAGMFSPVAFLWLVLGYVQQGEELRESARALHLQEKALQLQVQELSESVEQQTELARASNRQAALLEKSHAIALRAQVLAHQPRFVGFRAVIVEKEAKRVAFYIRNDGATCFDAVVFAITGADDVPFPGIVSTWWNGHEERIEQILDNWPNKTMRIDIRYRDAHLVEQTQRFELELIVPLESSEFLRASLIGMSLNLPPEDA